MALGGRLNVDEAVVTGWREAHAVEGEGTVLVLQIEGDGVVMNKRVDLGREGGLDAIFTVLRDHADADAALLAMVHPPDRRWTVVSFIPEGSAKVGPRVKMRVATAREELKKRLEASAFTADYQIFSADELTAAAFVNWQTRTRESAMSARELEKERIVAETTQARIASGGRMGGMALVPFTLADALVEAVRAMVPPPPPPPPATTTTSEDESGVAATQEAASKEEEKEEEEKEEEAGESKDAGDSAQTPMEQASAQQTPVEQAPVEQASQESAPTESTTVDPTVAAPAEAAPVPEVVEAPHNYVEVAIVGDKLQALTTSKLDGTIPTFIDAMTTAVNKAAPSANAGGGAKTTLSPPTTGAAQEPRFFVVKLTPTAGPVLVYYCPEGTVPRLRMTYSTAKATLSDLLSGLGIQVWKVVEGRDEDDLHAALTAAQALTGPVDNAFLSPGKTPTAGAGRSPSGGWPGFAPGGGAGGDGSATGGEDDFAKPSRPGRGNARIIGGFALPGMSPRGGGGGSGGGSN